MSAGSRRHLVQFDDPVEEINGAGESVVTWRPAFRAWVDITPLKSWQVDRAKVAQTNTTHTVRMLPDARVANGQRITWGSTILNIDGIIDVDGKGAELELACTQRTAP